MASCALESSTKNRLEDVRAFLFHSLDILQDPSKWPVKHAVQQLASQEAGMVFGEKYADRDKAAAESRFITLTNKREKHLCRSIHRARSEVNAVCYSPDGSQLARAEGSCKFFFSFLSSIFRPLPELLRVLTHLITNAGSGLWHGAQTAHHQPVQAKTRPSSSGTRPQPSACRR